MAIIETENLTKFYGKVIGVKNLTLGVKEGEIFGFLGPNGAGKTTTIRLLMGFLSPTVGSATVFGMNSWRQRIEIMEKVGYLPEGVTFYGDMTGAELLDYLGGFQHDYPPSLRDALCQRLGLGRDDLARKIKTYSRGMKQKLAIIQALQHDPPLLVLDEPTEGLDPLVQHEFLLLLTEFKGQGGTVFLSSHILPEVEKVCDQVGIIREGLLVEVQPIEELHRRKVRQMEITFVQEVDPNVFKLPGITVIEQDGKRLRLTIKGDINPVISELAKLPLEDLVFEQAHLEDIFIEYYRGEEKEP